MTARSGFTLLEVLVVVMIITILATIVGLNLAKEPGKARVAKAKATIGILKTALQRYRMEHGRVPTQEQGLQALCTKPERPPVPESYPDGGYLDGTQVPLDPWKRDYVYLCPGPAGEPFLIICYGADGEPGGADEDTDITSNDQN
jgi:general secretion pathway protein G